MRVQNAVDGVDVIVKPLCCPCSIQFIVAVAQCFCLIFFFFQAEDGIRDLTVTGVQTCALPISLLAALPARAATLLPLAPPPPDLPALIPFAEAPLDKPPIGVVDLALPEGPTDLPSFPPATVVAPWGDKPTAAVAHPGKLACVGAFFGVASMALECGRERYTKAEYEDAAKALEQAVRGGSEKDLVLEARYWLGETYWQLGRVEPADRLFRQVVQTAPKASDFALWATHSGGWTALGLGDATRARDTFAQLLSGAVPVAMEPWARHGLALASYSLGRHAAAVVAGETDRS